MSQFKRGQRVVIRKPGTAPFTAIIESATTQTPIGSEYPVAKGYFYWVESEHKELGDSADIYYTELLDVSEADDA